MPFIKEKFYLKESIKAILFLQNTLNIDLKTAQKMIDKRRVELNNEIFSNKAGKLEGEVSISRFVPQDLGLKPLFQTKDFAIFDKPPKLLTHPKGRFQHISLLDSVRFELGNSANIVNRLDSETSGILLASRHKQSEIKLKTMFENKEIQKEYLAYVFGKIKDCKIESKIKEQDKRKDLGIRSKISTNGKYSITIIKLIFYNSKKNISLIKAIPLTGRTHQIRLHLSHIGHRILGECLYGIDDNLARDFLDGEIKEDEREKFFGASRLMLHSNRLIFNYNETRFNIVSKAKFNI